MQPKSDIWNEIKLPVINEKRETEQRQYARVFSQNIANFFFTHPPIICF